MNSLLVIKKSMTMILTLVIMLSLEAPVMAQGNTVAPDRHVPAANRS
jgi:hypothetical protein